MNKNLFEGTKEHQSSGASSARMEHDAVTADETIAPITSGGKPKFKKGQLAAVAGKCFLPIVISSRMTKTWNINLLTQSRGFIY